MGLVVLPPLLVLVVLAVAVIAPQLGRSSDARDDQRRVRIAELAMQYSDELEVEQGLSARRITNETPELLAELAEQRTASDAAAARFLDVADQVDGLVEQTGPEVAELATAAPEVLAGLRTRLDDGQLNLEVALREYAEQLDAVDALTVALVFETTDATLLRRATALTAQLNGKRELSAALNRVAGRLEATGLIARDFAQFQNDYEDSLDAYDRFLATTDTEGAAVLEQIRSVPEVATIDVEAERIIDAGAAGDPYNVNAADWWRLSLSALGAYDRLDDGEFTRYLALATDEASDARRSAALFAAATVIGAVLAAAFAFLLGRSLSRRLQQVTDSAHHIAVDRLPEVLESLRNPTPEALAGAIPKVETTSTDEIGSLAESFNTVLRTSVETSIEHSARRAETLTNLLVNLGRRNQALLERQLQLIDTLEAREQDPTLLDGLFKLDHMVTRQRRNAESLLVLAGSRRSRAWSEPVPVSDVIRGAISEVADMGRVTFEMPPGHDLLVSGAHAVDLSHLLAELIENATSYSNPSTQVQLRVQRNGMHVRVWVIDSGVGMSDDEVVAANLRVADPPDIDELSTDQVGFQVIGRLARRLDARVRLQTNPVGGIAAAVDLPPAVFEPLTSDLPIVAVAEAETRAAAAVADPVSIVSDDQVLADLTAASEDDYELPELEVPAPRVVVRPAPAELPQRRRGAALADDAAPPPPAESSAEPVEPADRPADVGVAVDGATGEPDVVPAVTNGHGPEPLDAGAPLDPSLPRRVRSAPAAVVTPLFDRAAPAPVEPTVRVEPVAPLVAPAASPPERVPVAAAPALDRTAPNGTAPNGTGPAAPAALTADGLTRRTPGAAIGGSGPAADAELGLFRRLATPRDPSTDDPADRLRVLRAFSRGVDEARSDDPATRTDDR